MRLGKALGRLGASFSEVTERWVPDSWIVCMMLTVLSLGLAMTGGGAGPVEALVAWGDGVWLLLELAMQFTLAMIAAHVCVSSPAVYRLLDRVARLPNPRFPRQAVALVACVATSVAFLNWAVSVVGSAMLTAFVCRRNPKADVRVLAAASLLGMGTVWHGGFSGSAPLIMATPGNPLLDPAIGVPVVDRLYPITETLLRPFNLGYLSLVGLVGIGTAIAIHPSTGAKTLDEAQLAQILPTAPSDPPKEGSRSVAERLDDFAPWTWLAAILLAFPVVSSVVTRGFGATWTINAYNAVFLALGLALHSNPSRFLGACREGVGPAWGIIVQFPFYAGIFGLMQNTELSTWIGDLFSRFATHDSYSLVVYLYSGMMNLFVPSAGSKWLIEAPYLIPASQQLGVSTPTLLLAYAYGDSTTNLVQPFLAIPVLSILRMRFGSIAGYMLMLAIPCFVVTFIAMLLIPTDL